MTTTLWRCGDAPGSVYNIEKSLDARGIHTLVRMIQRHQKA